MAVTSLFRLGQNAGQKSSTRDLASDGSASEQPGPPPDGGARAWTMALLGHLVVFNTWGYILCYGVFQTYYTSSLDRSQSDIWVHPNLSSVRHGHIFRAWTRRRLVPQDPHRRSGSFTFGYVYDFALHIGLSGTRPMYGYRKRPAVRPYYGTGVNLFR